MRRPLLNALTTVLLCAGVCPAKSAALLLDRAPADTSTLEDVPLRLFIRDVFRDSLGQSVGYSARVDKEYGSVVVDGDSLSFIPAANYSGIGTVTLIGLAGGSRADSVGFRIRIIPVNDPPYFTSSVPEIAFHNNDSFSVNLEGLMRDVDSPTGDLSLEVDPLPGFTFMIERRTLSGRADSTIARSTVKVRAVDPEGARSGELGIPLFPNLPADSIPLLRPGPPKGFVSLQLLAPETGRFQVLSAYAGRMVMDTYLPDGSKAEGARRRAFQAPMSSDGPQVFPVGPNYLVISTSPFSAGSETGVYLVDRDFSVLDSLPLSKNLLFIKGVDTAGRRIYLQRTFPSGSRSRTVLEAYDFDLKPLPAPAFAGAFDTSSGSLVFHKGRTLVVLPRSDVWPLDVFVEVYSAEGVKESARELRVDHAASRDSLKPSIRSCLLAPYSGGYALFVGDQDYHPTGGGGQTESPLDFHSLYRKFGPDFEPLGPGLPLARDSLYQQHFYQMMEMGGGFLLNAFSVFWGVIRLDLRQYLYAFDADMNPRGQPDLRILPLTRYNGYSLFAPISDRQFIEVLQFKDGRRTGIVRTWDPAALSVAAPRAGGGNRIPTGATRAGILWDTQAKRAIDALGKRQKDLPKAE
jgi:hypothetical protein